MKRVVLFSMLVSALALAQESKPILLDPCESSVRWQPFNSTGVTVSRTTDAGVTGSAIRFDINFPKGSGYGGIVQTFDQDLPENYSISFLMKATVPVNNFEIKVSSDTGGENIWWVNNKGYTYPTDWKRVTVKKRHLGFAWGPKPASSPSRLRRIEIVVTAGTGGKGSVWIDDLQLRPIPLPPASEPIPIVTASSQQSKQFAPSNVNPQSKGTWKSKTAKGEWLLIDYGYSHEFGGVRIRWKGTPTGIALSLLSSLDGKSYDTLHTAGRAAGNDMILFTPESEARFLRLNLHGSESARTYEIDEVSLIKSDLLSHANQLLELKAKEAALGYYPRYFLKQASYWTIVGVPMDRKEAMIGEDGAWEVDKQRFSIEPFIRLADGALLHWGNSKSTQSLADGYLPIPTVTREYEKVALTTTLIAAGEAGSSYAMARYVVKNVSPKSLKGSFYLAMRPYQVNPTYQWLNFEGGVARTSDIAIDARRAVVDDKIVYVSGTPDSKGTAAFDSREIVEHIAAGRLPSADRVVDPLRLASGAFEYSFNLKAGDSLQFIAAVPFTPNADRWSMKPPTPEEFAATFSAMKDYWTARLNTVEFHVPEEAQKYVDVLRSYLGYILINKDGDGFQPGSRSYERSWMRDGSMTSDALLKLGIIDEPKKFVNWYSSYQYENGAVPCVVDTRGPDPVPEHDSHGELIFAIMEYFRFTGDTAFLKSRWQTVTSAVDFMQSLRAQRMTQEFADPTGEKNRFYGLVTESISHEGYSDRPRHSYWDNFFVIKGFKDAAAIAHILGEQKKAAEYDSLVKAFHHDLYASIEKTQRAKKIDYVPGCAELGDFDPTSTSIALFPCGEMKDVPQPSYQKTFDRYFDWFKQRAQGAFSWDKYTPYEVRSIGTYVYLGQKERAHYLLEWFMRDQRPPGWNHWAEVVWNAVRKEGFIGDMPHTWVGSDYINALRAMFVYEIDDESALVLGGGLKDSWVKKGLSVSNLPTHYGTINYSVKHTSHTITIDVSGTVDARVHRVLIPTSLLATGFRSASIGGKPIGTENGFVRVPLLPATVEFKYDE